MDRNLKLAANMRFRSVQTLLHNAFSGSWKRSDTNSYLLMDVPPFSSYLTAWTRQRKTHWGYDLHCTAPFKNLSPYCRAWYKSQIVDWDIPCWLLAQGLGPVMNTAISCWCMKREVHHRLLHIEPWQSFSVLVTGQLPLSLKVSVCCSSNCVYTFYLTVEIG